MLNLNEVSPSGKVLRDRRILLELNHVFVATFLISSSWAAEKMLVGRNTFMNFWTFIDLQRPCDDAVVLIQPSRGTWNGFFWLHNQILLRSCWFYSQCKALLCICPPRVKNIQAACKQDDTSSSSAGSWLTRNHPVAVSVLRSISFTGISSAPIAK